MNTKQLSHNTNRDNEIYNLWNSHVKIEEIADIYYLSVSRVNQIIAYKRVEHQELKALERQINYIDKQITELKKQKEELVEIVRKIKNE